MLMTVLPRMAHVAWQKILDGAMITYKVVVLFLDSKVHIPVNHAAYLCYKSYFCKTIGALYRFIGGPKFMEKKTDGPIFCF